MFKNLVWMFQEHRNLAAENNELKLHIDILTMKHENIVSDLERQLKVIPISKDEIEALFQDQPYPEGRIPDDVWLTPGQPDRAIR